MTFVKSSDAPPPTDEAMPKLPETAIRECKSKLIALLQPGENVLEALRRLGQSRSAEMQQKPTAAVSEPAAGTAADADADAAAAAPSGRRRASQMPAENRCGLLDVHETLGVGASDVLHQSCVNNLRLRARILLSEGSVPKC